MLSIGEIAHSTGVSRRMLRHWEDEGLLTPAVTDPVTGFRRYQDSQLARESHHGAARAWVRLG